MNRRDILALPLLLAFASRARAVDMPDALFDLLERAQALTPLKAVAVSHRGGLVAERGYRGNTAATSTNIKSASKSIISAMVGIAIGRGLLDGPDQRVAPLLRADLPDDPDPRIEDVTIGHLLSMQAGLGRTSGPNYGRWVASRNWVRAALAMPFEDEPGGRMLYSTGSTHLLSAILTQVGGKSSLELAREWFAPLGDFAIGGWERDPQGIYLGGNQMAMSTRSLLVFGELYRRGGVTPDGERIVPVDWVTESWVARTRSRFNGDGYGYGWFLREIGGHDVRYGWGHGGQMIYIVPELELTVAMTSDENRRSAGTGHRDDLHRLLADIIAAVESI